MMDSVEHIRLHHGVMYHVFKDDSLTDLQFVAEAPQPHIIAAQAGVAAQPVNVHTAVTHFGTPDGRLVGHFQAIGHVTGEADIQDCGTDAAVFHNVHNFGSQHSRLPGNAEPGSRIMRKWG